MGQREAIAFGEGVATTMRLKFEKMQAALIPGTAKQRDAEPAAGNGEDVDLAAIVERLRNVPRPQANLAYAEPVSAQLQPGDPGYRKPEPAAQKPVPAGRGPRSQLRPEAGPVRLRVRWATEGEAGSTRRGRSGAVMQLAFRPARM